MNKKQIKQQNKKICILKPFKRYIAHIMCNIILWIKLLKKFVIKKRMVIILPNMKGENILQTY